MNPFACLFLANPKRFLWTLVGVAALVAIFVPDAYHWFVERGTDELNWTLSKLVVKLWPWFQIAAYIAIAYGVIMMIIRPKKGG